MTGSSSRMLALLSLLQTPRDWPGRVLAERLEVSPRTVRRDVDRLRELGYRIGAIKGPDGGYRLAAGSELPPLLFDDDQAVAIAVALQTVPSSGIDIEEGAARALATVRQVMPSRLRHRVDGIRFTGAENATRVDPAVLEAASAAVRDRQVLRFDYGADRDRPARRTEPHAVVAREGRWYLLAWDLEAADWRTFRLDRMHPRIPTGPSFTPRPLPAADAETSLAAQAKGSATEDRWPCVGEVVIALPAREVAPWVDDGELEELADGSCRITVGSWSWVGVLAAVARFDAPFTVVGPAPLREAAGVLAARFAAVADSSS
ncbi:YafY family protein [Microbacterium sp. MYb66]|uniref:helix-turn-helix transcriptional regulator n=1 Tax=Microbacterium sp. MYb66 TaxID=1848692 RepID=UPI000CFF427C|nr:WYL domain-containing protein [Microbacterium sp. MYb66]PRA81416.1 transcriptional regulator [Microbacterium sp. MYb66]